MKHLQQIKPILTILLLSLLLIVPKYSSTAASDDPGADRLSGQNIPAAFYEDSITDKTSLVNYGLARYGSCQTTSPYTGKVYTHQNVDTGDSIVNGIDVSQWQKFITWSKVKAAGIDFAFIRLGYRGATSGTLNDDEYYKINMENASANGIKLGVYIYSQAITTKEAVEEADYVLERLGNYPISMPLVFDYEFYTNGRLQKAKLSKEEGTAICLAFCNRIAEAGYTPMVYANPDMLNNHLNPEEITKAGYRTWLANYTTNTKYTGSYDFWQYASDGKVDGITGNVDMNFYYSKPEDYFFPVIASISSATINPIPDQSYTGKAVTPGVTLTYEGQTLIKDVDYTIKYSNNTKLGTATVTITGIRKFNDTKKITFKIIPGSVGNVKAKKRSSDYITISWKKNSKVTGYQVYRATALDGKYKKLKTISSKSTITYKDKGLTDNEQYYYKVRSYIKSGKKTYYGAFSPIATISTKSLGPRTAVTKKATALYPQASTKSSAICNIPKGISMPVGYVVADTSGKTWYYVTCTINVDIPQEDGTTIQQNETYTGYIPISTVNTLRRGKIANGTDINVRKSNSTSSKVLTTLKKNTKVTILSTKKKSGTTWYQVTFKKKKKTYKGWISSPYIKIY